MRGSPEVVRERAWTGIRSHQPGSSFEWCMTSATAAGGTPEGCGSRSAGRLTLSSSTPVGRRSVAGSMPGRTGGRPPGVGEADDRRGPCGASSGGRATGSGLAVLALEGTGRLQPWIAGCRPAMGSGYRSAVRTAWMGLAVGAVSGCREERGAGAAECECGFGGGRGGGVHVHAGVGGAAQTAHRHGGRVVGDPAQSAVRLAVLLGPYAARERCRAPPVGPCQMPQGPACVGAREHYVARVRVRLARAVVDDGGDVAVPGRGIGG